MNNELPAFNAEHMTIQPRTIRENNARGWREYNAKVRIYFNFNETILENLEQRRLRPYAELKKRYVPHILNAMKLPADTEVRWSQKAGCQCGCSPGFIIEGVRQLDVWYDVK